MLLAVAEETADGDAWARPAPCEPAQAASSIGIAQARLSAMSARLIVRCPRGLGPADNDNDNDNDNGEANFARYG